MAWLAINKDDSEWIFEYNPSVNPETGEWWPDFVLIPAMGIELPKGTIEKILGYKLTFETSPVEIK